MKSDGIILARLDGTAGYAVHNKLPLEVAAPRLLEIADGRMDLIAQAAGTALGAWEVNPVSSWSGWMKADLLVAAGAELDLVRVHRWETHRRLRAGTHTNP